MSHDGSDQILRIMADAAWEAVLFVQAEKRGDFYIPLLFAASSIFLDFDWDDPNRSLPPPGSR